MLDTQIATSVQWLKLCWKQLKATCIWMIGFADLVKSEVETVSTVDEFEEKLVRSSFSDFVVI